MQRLRTKFFICLFAFFLGVVTYQGYLFITSYRAHDQAIEKTFVTVNEKQGSKETDFYTIVPCKEDVNPPIARTSKTKEPISGEGVFRLGSINLRVLCGNLPDYPESIRNKVSGLVKIEVHVDKSGKVLDAKAIDGNDSLQKASVESAKQTRFKPYIGKYSGTPFYFSGILTYEFNGERGVRLDSSERLF